MQTKKLERSHINDLIAHLKVVEQNKKIHPSVGGKLHKLRAEISKIEPRQQYKESKKNLICFFEKNSKITKCYLN